MTGFSLEKELDKRVALLDRAKELEARLNDKYIDLENINNEIADLEKELQEIDVEELEKDIKTIKGYLGENVVDSEEVIDDEEVLEEKCEEELDSVEEVDTPNMPAPIEVTQEEEINTPIEVTQDTQEEEPTPNTVAPEVKKYIPPSLRKFIK